MDGPLGPMNLLREYFTFQAGQPGWLLEDVSALHVGSLISNSGDFMRSHSHKIDQRDEIQPPLDEPEDSLMMAT